MKAIQSDEKLTKYLDQTLSSTLSKSHKCISNSLILPSSLGSYLVYFAKNSQQNLIFVAINVSIDQEKDSVRTIPVEIDSGALLENMVLQFSQSPYMAGAFAVIAFDPRERFLGKQKHVYLTSILLDELKDNNSVQFFNIASKYSNTIKIKDIKWYPFAALTLLILTESRLLVFKVDKNTHEPSFDLNLNDLEVQNASEITRKDQFEKIGFAENLNLEKGYSSLGKKLSLYLISNTGSIYLLFPFVSYQIILDETEKKALEEMRKVPASSFKRSEKAHKMTEFFKESKIGEIRTENHEITKQVQKEFELFTSWPSKIKREVFRLNPVAFSKSSSLNNYQRVEIFKPIILGRHTLFLTGLKLKTKQYEFRVMVFSEEPYSNLMQTSPRPQTFNIETVGQIKLDQSTDDEKLIHANGLQLFVPPTLDTNQLYLTHDKKTCYRVSLFGLEKFLRNPDEDDVTNLVEVGILFETKHKLLTMQMNDLSIFVVRSANESYQFESIPLKSLELKENINKTILETEELFKQITSNKEPKFFHETKSEEQFDFKAFKESTMIEIETKLKSFSEDYQKSVEYKLQKIKKLYEHIQSKNELLKSHDNQKQEMAKLVSQAQENEKKIKEIFSKEKNYLNKTEESIKRRIQATDTLLDKIKQKLEKEKEEIKKDQQKMELIEECEGQADGVINKLQEIKQQLIAKKNQLKKDLGEI